jgi:hypothetical protein
MTEIDYRERKEFLREYGRLCRKYDMYVDSYHPFGPPVVRGEGAYADATWEYTSLMRELKEYYEEERK